MKKSLLSVCAVAVVFVAVPVFGAVQGEGKNDRLLYSMNCLKTADSLPERIAKLGPEIAKGEKVYTPEELRILEDDLKDHRRTMRVLQKPGK
jgi:hypothetical protein